MHTTIQLVVITQPVQLRQNTAPTFLAQVKGGPPGATLNILTTQGDVLTHNGATQVRLPVGVDGQFLKANSGAAEGIEWDTVNAGDLPMAAPGASVDAGDTALEGVAVTLVRSDHQHAVSTGAAVGVDADTPNAEGTSSDLARADHTHDLPTAVAVGTGTVNAEGVSASLSRADHEHALTAHAGSHENGGSDEIDVTGLSGLLADGQTPLAHAATHLPSGSDPLTTAAANTILPDDVPAIGVAESFSRSDHRHGIAAAIALALLVGQVGGEGVSTSFSRADHAHAVAAAIPTATINAGDAAVEGVATTFVRSDHQHAVATAVAVTIDADTANAEGVSTSLARADHTHDIPTAIAVDVGTVNAEGASASISRADHVHAHANQAGGSLHAVATGAVAGFMSDADKTRHDAHLNPIDTTNPHAVTTTQAYVAGGGTATLNTTQAEFEIDGAALAAGAASTAGPDYFTIIRGAVNVLNTAYNATDLRTTIYSTAINGIDLSPDPAVIPDEAIISLTPNHLEFLRQDRTFSSVAFVNLFSLTSQITLDFTPSTLGAFVLFGPTIRYADTVNGFGMGLLFNASGIFENDPASAINLTTGLSFVGQNIYRANAQTITMLQVLDFLSQPRLQVTGGGLFTMTGDLRHFTARGTLLTGATLTGDRICFNVGPWNSLTGTHSGTNVGVEIEDIQSGVGGASGVRSVMTAGAGRFFLEHTGSAASLLGGELEVDGDLNHDGALAGFRGSAPVALSAVYTPTNVTPDRAFDANSTTIDELADVVGTMIADFQAQGLLG